MKLSYFSYSHNHCYFAHLIIFKEEAKIFHKLFINSFMLPTLPSYNTYDYNNRSTYVCMCPEHNIPGNAYITAQFINPHKSLSLFSMPNFEDNYHMRQEVNYLLFKTCFITAIL